MPPSRAIQLTLTSLSIGSLSLLELTSGWRRFCGNGTASEVHKRMSTLWRIPYPEARRFTGGRDLHYLGMPRVQLCLALHRRSVRVKEAHQRGEGKSCRFEVPD